MNSNNIESNENTIESNNNNVNRQVKIYNIVNNNGNTKLTCNLIIDIIFFISSFASFGFGIISIFVIDNLTGIGFILSGIFSGISLYSIRKIRIQASLQNSVNVLKRENDELNETNDELKENNEDLKENIHVLEINIDKLENIQVNLNEDLNLLKELIGIFGDNSDEIVNNLKQIYNDLKNENEIHASINKNSIYLHILHIFKHYSNNRNNFLLAKKDLEKIKEILVNSFPNLDYNNLIKKLDNNNKIGVCDIVDNIKI